MDRLPFIIEYSEPGIRGQYIKTEYRECESCGDARDILQKFYNERAINFAYRTCNHPSSIHNYDNFVKEIKEKFSFDFFVRGKVYDRKWVDIKVEDEMKVFWEYVKPAVNPKKNVELNPIEKLAHIENMKLVFDRYEYYKRLIIAKNVKERSYHDYYEKRFGSLFNLDSFISDEYIIKQCDRYIKMLLTGRMSILMNIETFSSIRHDLVIARSYYLGNTNRDSNLAYISIGVFLCNFAINKLQKDIKLMKNLSIPYESDDESEAASATELP